jgi:hypothetical protein
VAIASNREALIARPGPGFHAEVDHFAAAPDETTDAFHARLKTIARERDPY